MTRDTYRVPPGADIDEGDIVHTEDGPRRVVGREYYQSRRWGPAAQVRTEDV